MSQSLNNQEFAITTVSDLRQHLESVRNQQFSEVWLTANDDGPALAMLVNGAQAWLMYLRHQDGDPGFSSRHAEYNGPAEAPLEFLLSNGQMDEYPVVWTLPLEEAFGACEYFLLNHGGRSPAIVWYDDSSSQGE